MTELPKLSDAQVGSCVEAMRQLAGGNASAGRSSLEVVTWRPSGARKTRVREFVVGRVRGVPTYIAKMPLSMDDRKVLREYTVLSRMKRARVRTPQPLAKIRRGFVMQYVGTDDFPDVFAAAPDDAARTKLVLGVVDAMAAFHTASTHLRALSASESAVRQYVPSWSPSDPLAQTALQSTPVGPAHGDLGPWNIRCTPNCQEFYFIDWEDYRPVGLPLIDLLNFVMTLPLLIYPDYRLIGFERLYELAFLRHGSFGSLAGAALRRYAAGTGLSPGSVLPLIPFYCETMLERLRGEQRLTDSFFYGPFQARFELESIPWSGLDSPARCP